MAEWLRHMGQDPEVAGSNPCWGGNLPSPFHLLSVYTHAQEWSRTHDTDYVDHVRVRWIAERRTDPAWVEK